ncbi:PhoH family protein [Succinivibrio sp.]|uniref:PhoH family protein n=1 Tax=Succinivibrio sp. TaxID=2053619 RepID=UPI00386D77FF
MTKIVEEEFLLEPSDSNRMAYLVGPEDENFKQIEKRLGVKITYVNCTVHLKGEKGSVLRAKKLIKSLYIDTAPLKGAKTPSEVTPDMVHLAITEFSHIEQDDHDYQTDESRGSVGSLYHQANNFKTKRGFVKARTSNQGSYISQIVSHDVTFGIGPAGTGKTYLAVAAAVDALERNEVRRIILTRPAVEAGEKLGFLPGDLSQKVDPYLRPLYDALFEMLGFEKVEKLIEKQIIEIAPLAYMRGRTLNDSFIILDEAQNTTVEQMKMFLTRIGFNSKAVITGDPSQIDLPRSIKSGLKQAIEVLKSVDVIGFTFFDPADVVRHPVVAAIVNAYDAFDKEQARIKQEKINALSLEASNGD